MPEAMLIHIYTWFYYGNYVDPTCNTIIFQQGYQHHRQLILYMVNTRCIPMTSNINKLKGFRQYISPSFHIESHTATIDSLSDDASTEDNNEDDNNNDDDTNNDNNNAPSDEDIEGDDEDGLLL